MMEQLWKRIYDMNGKQVRERPAKPAEILAAATNLDGAAIADKGDGFIRWESGEAPPPGRYLVIPLPDKETPNG